MQEILSHMRGNGLEPGELVLDGKVHRFKAGSDDKGKAAWYVGFLNYTRGSGQPFYVVRYGNFKTNLVDQFQSDIQYSAEDKKALNDAIKKAKERSDAERRRVQEEVSAECETLWASFQTSSSMPPYLEQKKIDQLYGARIEITPQGVILWVPIRDVDGKLWSLQSIPSDGSGKKFYPGGRIQGCFHVIGPALESTDEILVAEGFATGASVHMATQRPVVCAFNSGNLEAVATILKQRFPEKTFVICGDDDRWTTNPKGDAWNPGRESAEAAAKKCMGVAIFPVFRALEKGKTTDFNDLHVIEGLDRVREQVGQAKPVKHYIVPLGYDAGDYYLLSNVNPQIQKLSSSAIGSSAGLLRLQPLVYWENMFPSQKGEGVSWTKAADFLMEECHRRGVFKPDRVRGRGVWTDQNRTVYHMGDKLWVAGEEMPLHRNKLASKYIYEMSEAMPPVHSNPLTIEDCHVLLEACELIRWRREQSFMFFAGWLAIAPIGGALSWRPHVWLTGPSGSGKSYVLQEIVSPLFQGFAQFFRGQTTEAGIRQKCGRSTMPVIFDEFETNDEKSSERIKSILELARQASSDSDGIVAKGTVSGDAMEFRPQFSMLVASVRTNLVHEEDENRFAVLDLRRGIPGESNFDRLQEIVRQLGPEYGRRLFARSLKLAPVIRQSAEVFRDAIAEKFPMRIGQQYGTLLAGTWSLTHDTPVSLEEAKDVLGAIDLKNLQDTAERNDELECLDYLMDKVIRGESGGVHFEASIRELIARHDAQGNYGIGPHYLDALERIGITRSGDLICLQRGHRSIGEFFKGSKWAANYGKHLARLDGAIPSEVKMFKTTRVRTRCVCVPISLVLHH